jgi:hypothetical protein
MADRFETSKGSFHLVVKRMSSALAGIMPEVMKWPNTQADFIKTSREFSEKSVSEHIWCRAFQFVEFFSLRQTLTCALKSLSC